MSDLFKDGRPQLSDDEDRRLWQRVRAIPGEVEGVAPARAPRLPWWRALWAMPAVRYGAPALAVLLVAVVWVAERSPVPPARVNAQKVLDRARSQEATPSPAPMPTSVTASAPTAANELKKATPELASSADKERDAKEAPMPTGVDAPAVVQSEESRRTFAAEPVPVREAAKARTEERAQAQKATPVAPPPAVRGGRANEDQFKVDGLPVNPPKDALSGGAAKAPASTPAPGANGGAVQSRYRDSGPGAGLVLPPTGVTDRLAAGTLPGAADLAQHPIVRDITSGRAFKAFVAISEPTLWAPEGNASYKVFLLGFPGGVSVEAGSISVTGEHPVPFENATAPARLAVLASLFEQALVQTPPSRARIEALREEVRRIDAAEGGYGRTRLLALLAGALKALPAR